MELAVFPDAFAKRRHIGHECCLHSYHRRVVYFTKMGVGGAVIGNDSDTLYVGSYNMEVRDNVVFAEHRVRITVMIIYRLTYGCVSWWKRYVCRSWVAVPRAFDVWSR